MANFLVTQYALLSPLPKDICKSYLSQLRLVDTFYLINQSTASSKLRDFHQSFFVVHHCCFFKKFIRVMNQQYPVCFCPIYCKSLMCRMVNVKYTDMYVCLT